MNKSVLNNITGWLVAAMALSYGSMTAAETAAGDLYQTRSVMVMNPSPGEQNNIPVESGAPTQTLAQDIKPRIPKMIASPRSHLTSTPIFEIINIYSWTIEDLDRDRYFQSFAVAFDAKGLPGLGLESIKLYAKYYLSINKGDWISYHTSLTFFLRSGGTHNLELETVLEGPEYYSGNYDVLIDIYEVSNNPNPILIASIDLNNSKYLTNLFLEGSHLDNVPATTTPPVVIYQPEPTITYGGAMEWFSLVGVFGFMLGRRYYFR